MRGALVAAQVAACMVLLLAAGLLLRGLHRAKTVDPGFRMKNVAAIALDLNGAGYDNQRAEALQRQLLQRIAALPGVNAAAQASAVPLDDNHRATDLSIPGREDHVGVEYNYVSPAFFPLLGISIVRGRNFTEAEGQTGAPVAILVESTARRLWPSEDPIGKTIRLDADYEVVGVAKDAHVSFLGRSDNIYAYLPAGPKQQLDLRLLISGTAGSPTTQTLRATVAALDPELAVEIVNLEEISHPGSRRVESSRLYLVSSAASPCSWPPWASMAWCPTLSAGVCAKSESAWRLEQTIAMSWLLFCARP